MNWQRGLFWTSILAGVVALLLVGGYYGGRAVYASEEGVNRPGFEIWSKVYRRPLYWSAFNREYLGYSYGELDQVLEERMRLIEFEEACNGALFSLHMRNGRGAKLHGLTSIDHDVALEDGHHYLVKFSPNLHHAQMTSIHDGIVRYKWYVDVELIEIKEVSDE